MAMAESSWPSPSYNSGAVSSAEFEAMNYYVGGGMMGLYNETAAIFADSSGRQIKIRAARYGVIHGFNWYSGTSDTTVAIAANASGSTRIDRVVLRLTRATWQVRVAVIAGTPGAGAPTFTQTYADSGVFEVSLALVTVVNAAASLAAGDVVFHAPYFAPTPMIAPTASVTPLTANNSARSYVGQTYLDAATSTMRFHNGTTIRQIADAPSASGSFEAQIYPPLCRLILNANFSVANNSNAVSVPFGSSSEHIKTHSTMHSTVTNNTRIIAPVPGIYEFTAVTVFAPNTTGFRTHSIAKNGVRQGPEGGIYNSAALPVGANAPLPGITTQMTMAANDYAELFCYQNSGGPLNIIGDGNPATTANTIFCGRYLRPLP
jgi:hypothetical protein